MIAVQFHGQIDTPFELGTVFHLYGQVINSDDLGCGGLSIFIYMLVEIMVQLPKSIQYFVDPAIVDLEGTAINWLV